MGGLFFLTREEDPCDGCDQAKHDACQDVTKRRKVGTLFNELPRFEAEGGEGAEATAETDSPKQA